MYKYIFKVKIAIVALLALASCQVEDTPEPFQGRSITFAFSGALTADASVSTRTVADRNVIVEFRNAGNNTIIRSVEYKFDGTPADGSIVHWSSLGLTENDKLDIYARAGVYSADQTTAEKIADADQILGVSTGISSTAAIKPIAIEMEHQSAKISFTITLGEGYTPEDINNLTMTIPSGAFGDIAPHRDGATITALLPPAASTDYAANSEIATIKVGDYTHTIKVGSAVHSFKSGKHYTANITLYKQIQDIKITSFDVGMSTTVLSNGFFGTWDEFVDITTYPEGGVFDPDVHLAPTAGKYVFTENDFINFEKLKAFLVNLKGVNKTAEVELRNHTGSIITLAFQNCGALTSFSAPAMTGSIEAFAFQGCDALTSITLGAVATANGASINGDAFTGCPSTAITLLLPPRAAGSPQQGKNIEWQGKVWKEIITADFYGSWADFEAQGITPDNALTAGKYTFTDDYFEEDMFTNLGVFLRNLHTANKTAEVELRNHTGNIITLAFQNCGALTSFSAPAMTGSIKDFAFENCVALTSIHFPELTGDIEYNAFESCVALTSASFPKMTGTISTAAFHANTALTTIYFPKMKGSIEDYAFNSCEVLTSASFPAMTGSIGIRSFYDCSDLADFYAPQMTGSISEYAFQYSYKLTSITLGAAGTQASDATISTNAFSDITSNSILTVSPLAAGSPQDGENIEWQGKVWKKIITANFKGTWADFEAQGITPDSAPTAGKYIFTDTDFTSESFNKLKNFIRNLESVGKTVDIELSYHTGSIEDYAFQNCGALTSFSAPAMTGSIGAYAFQHCNFLHSITIGPIGTGSEIGSVDSYAFDSIDATYTRLYIHSGAIDLPPQGAYVIWKDWLWREVKHFTTT